MLTKNSAIGIGTRIMPNPCEQICSRPITAEGERHAVHQAARRRQAHREGEEEALRVLDRALVPRQALELRGVDAAREELIGLGRLAREQLAELVRREVVGVAREELLGISVTGALRVYVLK